MQGRKEIQILGMCLFGIAAFFIGRQTAAIRKPDQGASSTTDPENTERPTRLSALSTSKKDPQPTATSDVASVVNSARAFGATFTGQSAAEIAHEIQAGVKVSKDSGTTTFQVPNISEKDIERLPSHVEFDGEQLSYQSGN